MSKAEVFIIESLKFSDEKSGAFEGNILSQILRLSDKEPIYYYIRTKQELISVLEIFKKSDYRYLHLSCHGNSANMFTTLNDISFVELAVILNPYLNNRRLFISACEMANVKLAKEIFSSSKCYSVIGPKDEIYYGDAAIFWASFYHLMFKENFTMMNNNSLEKKINDLVTTFQVPINYYTLERESELKFKTKLIKPKNKKDKQQN